MSGNPIYFLWFKYPAELLKWKEDFKYCIRIAPQQIKGQDEKTCSWIDFFFFIIFFLNLFIYLFLAVLGLRFCARAFSSCGKRGPLFIAVRRPLTVTASLVVEHRLQMCRLSNRGSRAQLLRGMWDPPRPGLEPACPAPAGRLSTTAPPGKPPELIFKRNYFGKFCR